MKAILLLLFVGSTVLVMAACEGAAELTPTPFPASPPPVPPAHEMVATIAARIAATPTPLPGPPGRQVADQQGCFGCHTTDGTKLTGPTWKGLFGKSEEIEGGDTVTVEAAYLEESIKVPGAKVVRGFPDIMPTILLSQDEIEAIVEYIQTLE